MNIPPPTETSSASPEITLNHRRDLLEVTLLVATTVAGVGLAQTLGPTTLLGNLAALTGVLLALAISLVAPRLRGESWLVLGFKPQNWPKTIGLSLALTVPVAALAWMVETWILPLLLAEPPDLSRFDSLEGNAGALIINLAIVWTTAAFGEEVIYRGFLMGRLARLMGGRRAAWTSALLLSSVLFGALHIYQGTSGVLLTGVAGLLLGITYLASGRNLWVAILVHGLVDTLSLGLLYLGLA